MVAIEGTYEPIGGGPRLAWRAAKPIVRFFWECDQRWPDRRHDADGTIGDARHMSGVTDLNHDGKINEADAALKSQHDPDMFGWVRAGDVDVHGIDPRAVVDAVRAYPFAWYVIFDRTIWSVVHGWQPRPYDGSDPHTGHVHVSLLMTSAAATSELHWGIYPQPAAPDTPSKITTRRPSMFLYAIPTGEHGPDGKPVERVYRPGRLLLPSGQTELVYLDGPTDHAYLSAGASLVHITADHAHDCGYVLPGEPGSGG